MDAAFRPAMLAITQEDLDELRRLLAADPDLVNRRSKASHPSLLQFVAVDGGLGLVPMPGAAAQVLVDAGASIEKPLVAAASTGCIQVIDVLLDAGAPIETGAPWTPAEEANYWGHGDTVAHLAGRGASLPSLRLAAGQGDVDAMAAFFSADGALLPEAGPVGCPFEDRVDPATASDPQHVLDQAFVLALINRQHEAADWLLAHGVDIDGVPTGTHWAGAALHAMVDFDRPETMGWLLARGASLDVRDTEFNGTPQGRAEFQGRQDLMEILAP